MDQKPAPTAPPSNPLLMVVSAIVSFLLWLAVVGQFVFLVPSLDRMSGEFRMTMPLLTEWVSHSSRWAVPTITIAALFVCIAVGRRSPWPWLFLLFLLPLAINMVLGMSFYFPYMDVLDGLSGTKK